MEDEAAKIFLNAKGILDDVSKELRAFLNYAAGEKMDFHVIRGRLIVICRMTVYNRMKEDCRECSKEK